VASVQAIVRLLPLFAIMPFFWASFTAQGSVWVLQRLRMNNCFGTLCLTPEQLGGLNPILVLLLVPLFSGVVLPALTACSQWGAHAAQPARRAVPLFQCGLACLRPTPLRRIVVGMGFVVATAAATAIVQAAIDAGPPGSVHAGWQVPQFVLVTVAELLVTITMMEVAFARSPPAMQSTVLSLLLVTVAIGDGLMGAVYGSLSHRLPQATIAWMLTGVMAAAWVGTVGIAWWESTTAQMEEEEGEREGVE